MKYFLICLAAAFLFAGCKKNKELSYTLKGVVTDVSFNSPAAGVTVNLYKTAAGGNQALAGTVVTGSDGAYSFDIKREKTESYKVEYSENNYFPGSYTFTLEDLDAKKDNVYDLTITAKSWVRLIFKNTDAQESVSVGKTGGLSGCSECCPFSALTLTGVTDTSFICINTAGTSYSYSWIYAGGTSYTTNSVISAPLDTTDLVLNF